MPGLSQTFASFSGVCTTAYDSACIHCTLSIDPLSLLRRANHTRNFDAKLSHALWAIHAALV